jgi:hypothetical protein
MVFVGFKKSLAPTIRTMPNSTFTVENLPVKAATFNTFHNLSETLPAQKRPALIGQNLTQSFVGFTGD